MPLRKLIPDVIRDQEISALAPDATVQEAVDEMARRLIGAVLVMRNQELIGIFTERDVLNRVIARRRDPGATRLHEVMTPDPDTLPPEARPAEALAMMRDRKYRHLPILASGRVVGVISIRDLYAAVQRELESDLQERDAYIHNGGYGITP